MRERKEKCSLKENEKGEIILGNWRISKGKEYLIRMTFQAIIFYYWNTHSFYYKDITFQATKSMIIQKKCWLNLLRVLFESHFYCISVKSFLWNDLSSLFFQNELHEAVFPKWRMTIDKEQSEFVSTHSLHIHPSIMSSSTPY